MPIQKMLIQSREKKSNTLFYGNIYLTYRNLCVLKYNECQKIKR